MALMSHGVRSDQAELLKVLLHLNSHVVHSCVPSLIKTATDVNYVRVKYLTITGFVVGYMKGKNNKGQ